VAIVQPAGSQKVHVKQGKAVKVEWTRVSQREGFFFVENVEFRDVNFQRHPSL
jgi:hypothetical protein